VSYRAAAVALWGDAGAYAHDAYTRLRVVHFPHLPEQMPITIGLTAYGRCLGLTRGNWTHGPRISLAAELFNGSRGRPGGSSGRLEPGRISGGSGWVDDVLVHEMLHANLHLTGQDSAHNGDDWYAAVQELSPAILGHELDVKRGADRKSVRVLNPDYRPGAGYPKTLVRKVPAGLGWVHDMVARWPSSFRPSDYNFGERIHCPTY
jgi:hypothetical protein